MKNVNKTTIAIALIMLAVGLLVGWLFFGSSSESIDQVHNHAAISETETVWTCSMHPQIRKNESGDCPICGMELIPLDSEHSLIDPAAINMSPVAMKLANVQTSVVTKENSNRELLLSGKVYVDERRKLTQAAHIPGRIEALKVAFTGEYITRGQELAKIYSPDLVTAQKEVFEARKIKDRNQAIYHAAIGKLRKWKLSPEQIDAIEQSGEVIENFPILANVSGYVTKKNVNLGDYVKVGQPLFEVSDLSKLWVLFDIYESDLSFVSKGDYISFTISSLPGRTFESTITYVDPTVNPLTRVTQARVEVPNPDLLLRPEQFVSGLLHITANSNSTMLSVPKSAVMWTGRRSVVYVKKTQANKVSFVMREVVLGADLGNSYRLESGLTEGEEIATNGTFSIDAAAQLAGKPSMMNPEGGVVITGHNHGVKPSEKVASQTEDPKQIKVSNEAKIALSPLFKAYFSFSKALADDNLDLALKEGEILKAQLNSINPDLLDKEGKGPWQDQSALLAGSLMHIQHQKSLIDLRASYQDISNQMIAIAKTFQPLDDTLYVQHCPMANSNKGAEWLSLNKEIENPYFGSSMLKCGETINVIPNMNL